MQSLQLAIMCAEEADLSDDRSEECQKHIPLSVPLIALGSEKGGGGFTERTRDSPFEEFIGCAKREAY